MATKPTKATTSKKAAGKPAALTAKKVAKSAPAKKASAKKAAKPATKPAAKKAATKAPAKSSAQSAKKDSKPVTKSTAKQAAKKAAPKKEVAKKSAPKKETPKKETAKKAATKTAAPTAKKAATKSSTKETAAKSASTAKAQPAKEKATKEKAPKSAPVVVAPPAPVVPVVNPIAGAEIPQVRKAVPGKKPAPKQPAVQEDESKWTPKDLEKARKMLEKEAQELLEEIAAADEKFQDLIFESGEGAGDDQADAGTKTFEREQEISLLANKRDLLDQTHHALERIAAGTYGNCENCGNPIGKLRLLEANPRATLCMPCRQKQDRGY